jgi:hypothetical protein
MQLVDMVATSSVECLFLEVFSCYILLVQRPMKKKPSARTKRTEPTPPMPMPMPLPTSIAIQLRVNQELAAAIDREVARLQAERFGSIVSRADVVREILARTLMKPR